MKAFISRRDFLKAAGVTAAAAALAGCSSSNGGGSASGSAAGGKTIKIGVFEPASGDNGAGGKQEVLAIEYANSIAPTVDIGGETYNVELVEVDNQSSTDKAVTAAQELVSKKVSIVLGSYGSGCSIAAAPTFQAASIPAIGCSCTNPAVTEANPYYFRVCFLDPFQGSVMASFAKDQFGASNAYVLSMLGEDYGSGLATYFVNAFEALGGTVLPASSSPRAPPTSPLTSRTPSTPVRMSSLPPAPPPMRHRSSPRRLRQASISPSPQATPGSPASFWMPRRAPTCRCTAPPSLMRTMTPALPRSSSPATRSG